MEELFNKWLKSLDTSTNVIEHLKTQKNFHIEFIKYAVGHHAFADTDLLNHIKPLLNEIRYASDKIDMIMGIDRKREGIDLNNIKGMVLNTGDKLTLEQYTSLVRADGFDFTEDEISKEFKPKESYPSPLGIYEDLNKLIWFKDSRKRQEAIDKFVEHIENENQWIETEYALPPKDKTIIIPCLKYNVKQNVESETECIYNDEIWKTLNPIKWKHV